MSEKSLFSSHNWTMTISGIEGSEFIVKTRVPDIACSSTEVNARTATYHLAGDKITFEPLIVDILLNENIDTFIHLYEWFVNIRSPKSENTNLSDKEIENTILLSINGNQGASSRRIIFYDVRPTALSGFELSTQTDTTEAQSVTLTVVFSYFNFI